MHGFEGATLPKIAASAGVSTPLLVHYFKSKRQLWETVFERLSADSRNELEALASEPGSSAAERLRRIIAFQVRFFIEKPAIFQLLAHEAHLRTEVGKSAVEGKGVSRRLDSGVSWYIKKK